MSRLSSIVTHDDFDGLGSAALLSWAFDLEDIRFAGPLTIARAEIPVTLADAVCDLPYPLECGMWFDHHVGNLDEVRRRGIDPASIPGRFAAAPSCVRVIYDYLREEDDLPADFAELADAADLIDSFSFPSLEAWRADTPANRLDRALKATPKDRRAHYEFLREVTRWMRDLSLSEIAEQPEIIARAQQYAREEERMLEHIRTLAHRLPQDEAGELLIVDTTAFLNPVRLDKRLIGLLYPQAQCFLELKPVFRSGRKTNDLSLALSLALHMQHREHGKDVGEIMRLLNVGDGHAGAAAGVFRCSSLREFNRLRAEIPNKIFALWKTQPG